MTIRTVLRMGDPRLLQAAAPVTDYGTPALAALITDMFDTMAAEGGVGLAAPQIGVDLRVVIFGFEHSERYPDAASVPTTILINPVITPLNDETEDGWEGCLSVPGLRGVVPRHTRIRYQGFTPDGTPIDRIAEGFHARVVQHECDHLDGTLYPMRIRDFRRFGFTDVLFPELDQPSRRND
jgi:peptide deformylase